MPKRAGEKEFLKQCEEAVRELDFMPEQLAKLTGSKPRATRAERS